MADISATTSGSKRVREEDQDCVVQVHIEEESKRHKSSCSGSSYNQILSLLEDDEEEPNQDLSSLITSLQQEISTEITPNNNLNSSLSSSPSLQGSSSFKDSSEDEDDKDRVIRHLLEASDDELGIPNGDEIGVVIGKDEDIFGSVGGGFELSLCDGLWEFEDETANYYTLLQSELFL
ncbi:hypothetical protein ACHQM5_006199 [Ranunculus cassubicifolius]